MRHFILNTYILTLVQNDLKKDQNRYCFTRIKQLSKLETVAKKKSLLKPRL